MPMREFEGDTSSVYAAVACSGAPKTRVRLQGELYGSAEKLVDIELEVEGDAIHWQRITPGEGKEAFEPGLYRLTLLAEDGNILDRTMWTVYAAATPVVETGTTPTPDPPDELPQTGRPEWDLDRWSGK